jgi:hypothetical protein
MPILKAPDINQEIIDLEATLVSLKAKAKAKAKAQQEPTLTPVAFESKGELAKALVDGRTFKTSGGTTLMYDISSGYESPFRIMRDGKEVGAMINVWNLYADLQEINAAPWYLNIPAEGVECYVSDVNTTPFDSSNTATVMLYNPNSLEPFRDELLGVSTIFGTGYKYATPVNKGAPTCLS